MSAGLMKFKFVRLPSVRVAIISEPNAHISFKFHLWLLLDYLQRHFVIFEKKNCDFLRIFVVFAPIGSHVNENDKYS